MIAEHRLCKTVKVEKEMKNKYVLDMYSTVSHCENPDKLSDLKNKFSDEAHFELSGYANNFHIWGTEHPHAYIEKRTHPKRVTVWYHLLAHLSSKMSKERLLQPMAIVIEFLFTKIEEEDIGNIWFQQGGAT